MKFASLIYKYAQAHIYESASQCALELRTNRLVVMGKGDHVTADGNQFR